MKQEIRSGFGVLSDILRGFAHLQAEADKLGIGRHQFVRPDAQIRPQADLGDPYITLGIERGAPPKMIKEIYLVKALWYHPDSTKLKGGNPAAFRRIQGAYEMIERELEGRS